MCIPTFTVIMRYYDYYYQCLEAVDKQLVQLSDQIKLTRRHFTVHDENYMNKCVT